MALESPAYVISASSHSADLFRQTAQSMIAGTGVVGSGDLLVSANGTPNMSVNVAAGFVWCPGTLGSTAGMQANANAQTTYGLPSSLTAQGSYGGYNDGTVNLAIAAADPTNPRIDLICASIQDAEYAGSNNQPVLQVVTGSPAASPSAPSAPASSVVLAQVAVAAGATSVVAGNITDERPHCDLLANPVATAPLTPGTGYSSRYVSPGWWATGGMIRLRGAVKINTGNFAAGWTASVLTGLPAWGIPSGYAAGRTLFMPAVTDNGSTVLVGVEPTTYGLSVYISTGNTTVTTVYFEGMSWRYAT